MVMATVMTDELDMRKRRLRFRAWHRGTKEADLLIGGFIDSRLPDFSAKDVTWLEVLLDENDVDIMAWMTGSKVPPAAFAGGLMADMRLLDSVPQPGSYA
jgi:antitoxin CptB